MGPVLQTSLECELELGGYLGRIIYVRMGASRKGKHLRPWRKGIPQGTGTLVEVNYISVERKIQVKKKFKEDRHPPFSFQSQGFYAPERAPDGRRQKSAVTFASLTSGSMCVFLVNMIKNTVNYMLILCWRLLYDALYIAVYILHIYIQITVQSCIHKAMHTVLHGKFKSISEVIRTICDFPLLGCGREMNLEIGKGLPWRLGGPK